MTAEDPIVHALMQKPVLTPSQNRAYNALMRSFHYGRPPGHWTYEEFLLELAKPTKGNLLLRVRNLGPKGIDALREICADDLQRMASGYVYSREYGYA